jgi:hypothetical protein
MNWPVNSEIQRRLLPNDGMLSFASIEVTVGFPTAKTLTQLC